MQLAPRHLSEHALIELYDQAERLPHSGRRIAMAGAFSATEDAGGIAVGDAERLLWQAKARQFGGTASSQFACDACGETVSFQVPETFRLDDRSETGPDIQHDGQSISLAYPSLDDVAAGTVLSAISERAPWDDEGFRKKAAEAMDAADPAMDVIFEVACADCGHVNPRSFDAATFLWADLDAFASSMFAQVALLARAFGWSEAETLALPPTRRARYVGMVS